MMDDDLTENIHTVGKILWLSAVFFIVCITANLGLERKSISYQEIIQLPVEIPKDIAAPVLPLQLEKKTVSVRDDTYEICFGKKKECQFHPIIMRAANRYQVDPYLVKAIIMAESSYNPKAVSKAGAVGLMQLMPGTAKELGVKDGFNPEQNIDAGVRYFKKLLNRFNGDIELALAAYNAGFRKVRMYRGIPPFKATQLYIKKVCEYYQDYKNKAA